LPFDGRLRAPVERHHSLGLAPSVGTTEAGGHGQAGRQAGRQTAAAVDRCPSGVSASDWSMIKFTRAFVAISGDLLKKRSHWNGITKSEFHYDLKIKFCNLMCGEILNTTTSGDCLWTVLMISAANIDRESAICEAQKQCYPIVNLCQIKWLKWPTNDRRIGS